MHTHTHTHTHVCEFYKRLNPATKMKTLTTQLVLRSKYRKENCMKKGTILTSEFIKFIRIHQVNGLFQSHIIKLNTLPHFGDRIGPVFSSSFKTNVVNLLKTKRDLLSTRNQFVPRSKPLPPRL